MIQSLLNRKFILKSNKYNKFDHLKKFKIKIFQLKYFLFRNSNFFLEKLVETNWSNSVFIRFYLYKR